MVIKDIYYNRDYCKLYEKSEDGTLESFVLDCEYGTVEHLFIKRKIHSEGVSGYFDIITPYGYGGPIITDCKDKKLLIAEFKKSFSEYCRENNIVSEFIRFHPIYENAPDFTEVYDTQYSRHTVGTNLKDFDDPVRAEFAKSLRKELRRAVEAGVTCQVIRGPKELNTFRRLYEETMDRNKAAGYYYFGDDYWDAIVERLGDNVLELQLVYQDEVIASEIYFIQGKYMHAHLLGGSEKMLELNAGVMLEATAARWGRDNGYEYIHHGGGRTSADDDSLFLYKMKYGKNTRFDFYVGKKVWNQEVYDLLVSERIKEKGEPEDKNFFPAYRA